jgi:hypothetical protein
MNIDLLVSKDQDVGIVSTGKFESRVTAALFDHETGLISLEFGETMDSMPLNIPVSEELTSFLNNRSHLYVIGTDRKHIHEAYRIPLMHLNMANAPDVGEWA